LLCAAWCSASSTRADPNAPPASGHGSWVSPSGEAYEGSFEGGRYQGLGLLKFTNGATIMEQFCRTVLASSHILSAPYVHTPFFLVPLLFPFFPLCSDQTQSLSLAHEFRRASSGLPRLRLTILPITLLAHLFVHYFIRSIRQWVSICWFQ